MLMCVVTNPVNIIIDLINDVAHPYIHMKDPNPRQHATELVSCCTRSIVTSHSQAIPFLNWLSFTLQMLSVAVIFVTTVLELNPDSMTSGA
jgi:hypothetical protein